MNSFDFPTACAIGVGALALWALARPGRWRRALAWAGAWIGARFSSTSRSGSTSPLRRRASVASRSTSSSAASCATTLDLRPLALGRARALRESLSDLGKHARGRLRPPVPPGAAGSARLSGLTVALIVAVLAAFVTLATGRLTQPYRLLWLLTAVALGPARERRGRLPARRVRRHGQLPLQHRLQDGLSGVVPARSSPGSACTGAPLARTPRAGRRLAGLAALVALALVYPIAGVVLEVGSVRRKPDARRHALARAAQRRPTRPRSHWLRRLRRRRADAPPGGRARLRSRRTRARVSTFTGLPAVMGWAGHEAQWGHDPGSRLGDVQLLYSTRGSRGRARAPRPLRRRVRLRRGARAASTTRPRRSRSSSAWVRSRSGRARRSSIGSDQPDGAEALLRRQSR